MAKKILFIGPTSRSIHTFRLDLILEMKSLNYEVHVACEGDEFLGELSKYDIFLHDIKMARFMSPLRDLNYMLSLIKVMMQFDFDIVHTFTIKPNFYGSLANLLTGRRAKLVALVEGFGFLYGYDQTLKTYLKRALYFWLNKIAFAFAHKVWFINQDDKNEMIQRKIIKESKSVFIKSIGVNVDLYSPENVCNEKILKIREKHNISDSTIVISLVSRMNHLKGVGDLIEAGRMILNINPKILILLIGEIQEDSPYSMIKEDSEELPANVEWVGFTRDINEYNFVSNIACLPTYYREGVPRSLIEAMSFKKPLVVSDSVGCRELVGDGVNGYLVPIKDPISLSKALLSLAGSDEDMLRFGEKSFDICIKELDVNIVNHQVITDLYGL